MEGAEFLLGSRAPFPPLNRPCLHGVLD